MYHTKKTRKKYSHWPQGAEERLLALKAQGKTAAECGAVLSTEFGLELSRSAILGKLHRLRGGTKTPRAERKSRAPRAELMRISNLARFTFGPRNPRPQACPPDAQESPATLFADEPPPSDIALPDWAPANTCQWLHGDPAKPEARWCAAPVDPENRGLLRRYCPHHAARVLRHDRERSHFHGA